MTSFCAASNLESTICFSFCDPRRYDQVNDKKRKLAIKSVRRNIQKKKKYKITCVFVCVYMYTCISSGKINTHHSTDPPFFPKLEPRSTPRVYATPACHNIHACGTGRDPYVIIGCTLLIGAQCIPTIGVLKL